MHYGLLYYFIVAKYPLPSVDSENGHTECLLTLTNTSLKRIGFKMKSTAVQHYGADPATGIIEPGRRLIVSGNMFKTTKSCACEDGIQNTVSLVGSNLF